MKQLTFLFSILFVLKSTVQFRIHLPSDSYILKDKFTDLVIMNLLMHLLDNMPIKKAIQLLSTFHRQGTRVKREKIKSLRQLRDQHLQLDPQFSAFFVTST